MPRRLTLTPRTHNPRLQLARSSRRRKHRRSPRLSSMLYTCVFSILKTSVTRPILASHFKLDVSRICRTKFIRFTYSSPASAGLTFTFTIESATSTDDAVNRSPSLMFSPIPRTYTLWTPRSTDYAYINSTHALSELSIYDPSGQSNDHPTYFNVSICMEYRNAQPQIMNLGSLDDTPQQVTMTHTYSNMESGPSSPFENV